MSQRFTVLACAYITSQEIRPFMQPAYLYSATVIVSVLLIVCIWRTKLFRTPQPASPHKSIVPIYDADQMTAMQKAMIQKCITEDEAMCIHTMAGGYLPKALLQDINAHPANATRLLLFVDVNSIDYEFLIDFAESANIKWVNSSGSNALIMCNQHQLIVQSKKGEESTLGYSIENRHLISVLHNIFSEKRYYKN